MTLAAFYDDAFYSKQCALSFASAQVILPIVFARYQPTSIVDFGAGVGTFLSAALELGVAKTSMLGIEGDWVQDKHPADVPFLYTDLEVQTLLPRRFDLAISLEVAEHLTPARSAGFVDDLCAAADVVLFSAAIPGQGGRNHINERAASYWQAEFARNGYMIRDCIRGPIWGNNTVASWYRQNTFLYLKQGHGLADAFQNIPLPDALIPEMANKTRKSKTNYSIEHLSRQKARKLVKALLYKARW